MRRHHLREIVPAWIDGLLYEWSGWMHSDDGVKGFPKCSAGFGAGGSLKEWDDLEDSVDGWRAKVADSIINGLEMPHKLAISNVYLCTVWSSNRWSIEQKFSEAVDLFGEQARRRGLV